MNSSISRWLSRRCGVAMRTTRPSVSSSILRSGRSSSRGCRRSRAAADVNVERVAVGAGEKGVLFQPAIEHAVETAQLARVALDRLGNRRRRVDAEVTGLARHRPQARHLPEQPLQCVEPRAALGRQQLAGLVREVQQDRARLEHRQRGAAVLRLMVDDGGNLAVGRDRKKRRRELLARRQTHRNDPMRQPGFFQEQPDLQAIGGGAEIQIDHDVSDGDGGLRACEEHRPTFRRRLSRRLPGEVN